VDGDREENLPETDKARWREIEEIWELGENLRV